MKGNLRLLVASVVSLLSLSRLFSQELLLDDDFPQGRFQVQNPPHSTEWFINAGALQKSAADGLTLSNANERFRTLTYFSDQPVAVDEGHILTLVCKFSLAGNLGAAQGFLSAGLFDSRGSRLSSNIAAKEFNYSKYRGYALTANLVGPSRGGALSLSARNGKFSKSLLQTGEPWTKLGSNDASLSCEEGKLYTLTLSIAHRPGKMFIAASITEPEVSNQEVAVADNTLHCTAFDSIALSCKNGIAFETFKLISVKVTLDSNPRTKAPN